MRFPPEFGIQRHAQVFVCVLIWNKLVVDIDWELYMKKNDCTIAVSLTFEIKNFCGRLVDGTPWRLMRRRQWKYIAAVVRNARVLSSGLHLTSILPGALLEEYGINEKLIFF
jgi:hypothetical protein